VLEGYGVFYLKPKRCSSNKLKTSYLMKKSQDDTRDGACGEMGGDRPPPPIPHKVILVNRLKPMRKY